jgi:hypothetical protein
VVVPHCLLLLRKFKCHINFEIAGSSHLFQYCTISINSCSIRNF